MNDQEKRQIVNDYFRTAGGDRAMKFTVARNARTGEVTTTDARGRTTRGMDAINRAIHGEDEPGAGALSPEVEALTAAQASRYGIPAEELRAVAAETLQGLEDATARGVAVDVVTDSGGTA